MHDHTRARAWLRLAVYFAVGVTLDVLDHGR